MSPLIHEIRAATYMINSTIIMVALLFHDDDLILEALLVGLFALSVLGTIHHRNKAEQGASTRFPT